MTATRALEAKTRSWFWSGEEPEWLVVLTVLVALLLGSILMAGLSGQRASYGEGDVALRYPARWTRSSEEGALLVARDLPTGAGMSLRVLRVLDPKAPVMVDELVTQLVFDRARDLAMFRPLKTSSAKVGGRSAVAVEYAYVQDSAESAYQSAVPVVIRGVSYVWPHQGKAYVLSLEASESDYAVQAAEWQRIVRSVRLK